MEVSDINALKSIWDGFDFSNLLDMLLSIIPALVCITLHELSHGFVAYRLGDDTAKKAGRLTLNPIRHLDVMGLIMMVVFHFGWAKPVPVNMYKFKNPKRGMAITALAGPVSNIIIAVVFMFIYGLLYIPLSASAAGLYFLQMIMLTAYISIGLAVFNLIPVPPLDGSKVLFSLMSDEAYYKLMRYERYGTLAMILLVSTGILGRPLDTAVRWLYDAFIPIAQFACNIILKLFYT